MDEKRGNESSKPRSSPRKQPPAGKSDKKGVRQKRVARQRRRSPLIPAISVILLIGAISVAIYAFTVASVEDPCVKILESMSTGKIVEGADMNPLKMHVCRVRSCNFDLSQCEVDCPLSYKSDDSTGCPVSCECATHGIHQGDVRYDPAEVDGKLLRFGHRARSDFSLFFATAFMIWNETIINGRMKVPYKMDPTMSYQTIEVWNEAVKDLAQRTCIDLVHHTNEKDFLDVLKTIYCASKVGRVGSRQLLELGGGCGIMATVQHELLHAFGFDHEQSRPDRDLHVNILEENIDKFHLHNFDKVADNTVIDLGSKYDQESGIHYRSDDFAKLGKMSMTYKPDGRTVLTPSRERLMTDEDVRELNLLYRCRMEQNTQGTWREWSSWSECSKSCLKGLRTRTRDCYDHAGHEISNCPGGTFEYEDCDHGPCPAPEGVYEPWGEWGKCDKECEVGKQVRYRSCPRKYTNGCKAVFGIYHIQEEKACKLKDCEGSPFADVPFEMRWLEWNRVGECNQTCGGGFIKYVKQCACGWQSGCHIYNCDPEYNFAEHGAHEWSPGELKKWEACNTHPCGGPPPQPVNPARPPTQPFGTQAPPPMTHFPQPTQPFGTQAPPPMTHFPQPTQPFGTQAPPPMTHFPQPTQPFGTQAPPFITQFPQPTQPPFPGTHMPLPTQPPPGVQPTQSTGDWSEWGSWGRCDKICGDGNQVRVRHCLNQYCTGQYFDSKPCNVGSCSGFSSNYGASKTGRQPGMMHAAPERTLFQEPGQVIQSICIEGKLVAGKFNSDELEDFLCLNSRKGLIQLYFASDDMMSERVNWEGNAVLCDHVAEIHVRFNDINGDNMDDIICRNPRTKDIEVFLNKGGRFAPIADWKGQREFCQNAYDILNVHDFNGDGKSDLICGDAGNAAGDIVLNAL